MRRHRSERTGEEIDEENLRQEMGEANGHKYRRRAEVKKKSSQQNGGFTILRGAFSQD